jgi:hypothetical protein
MIIQEDLIPISGLTAANELADAFQDAFKGPHGSLPGVCRLNFNTPIGYRRLYETTGTIHGDIDCINLFSA